MIGKNESSIRGEFSVPPAVTVDKINQNKDKYTAAGIDSIKKMAIYDVVVDENKQVTFVLR